MKGSSVLLLVGACLVSAGICMTMFIGSIRSSVEKQIRDNSKSFAIDSVAYSPNGNIADKDLPYWRCHLKGTSIWMDCNDNREVGDSLHILVKF